MAQGGTRARMAGRAQLWRAARPMGVSEGVYGRIKARILDLDLAPGAALSEPDLALQYGVSRTPIREALIRLADEGLVSIIPKSGTMVSRIPVHLLPEAILVRQALEDVTVRHAAARATRSDLLRLEASILSQEELVAAADFDSFHLADEEFHALIAGIAGLPGIWTLVERAKMHIDRYRRLTLPQAGRMERVVREHRAVLEAIAHGDPDAAARAMAAHVSGLVISIEAVRDANPDFFEGEFDRPAQAGGGTHRAAEGGR